MKVNVIVKPKEAVLDPQGNAVRDAMRHLGMPEVRGVRIGKFMEIDVEGTDAGLERRLHVLCRDLLSNPVIEDYEMRRAKGEGRKAKDREQRSEISGHRSAGAASKINRGASKKTPNAQRPTSNTQREKAAPAKATPAKKVSGHQSQVRGEKSVGRKSKIKRKGFK